jgi:SAM-dependent methyltransferase
VGLARGAVALLLEESQRRKFSGRVATLGVQNVYMSVDDLVKQFARFSIEPAQKIDQSSAEIDDKKLFKLLGFDSIDRIDYSDFEGAEHIVDLNKDGLPENLLGQFDAVVDSGTLEHVFHVPNALKNIISLVKVGGRIIFLSPSSNHMDHGFYMFSPTLFADYFLANKFEIDTGYVVRYSPNLADLWDVYQYDPGRWRDLHIGGLDDMPYAVFFVVTRTAESTSGIVPQQNYYADSAAFYDGARLPDRPDDKASKEVKSGWAIGTTPQFAVIDKPRTLRRFVGKVLRKVPFAYRLALRLVLMTEKRHLNKKLVGRY